MGAASTEGSSTTHRQRTWLIQDKEVIVNVNDFDGSTKDGSLVPDDVHMMTISKRNVSQIVSSGCRRETVVVGFTGTESGRRFSNCPPVPADGKHLQQD